jgi:hypothetical protein
MSVESGLRAPEWGIHQRISEFLGGGQIRDRFFHNQPCRLRRNRCDSSESRIFTNVKNAATDLKAFDVRSCVSAQAEPAETRQHSIALAYSIEHFLFPRDLVTVCA